ncbi:MAG TPA: glycoside hydrolase family 2 TIM barrel-domain containing protein [Ktedonobacteraceae bacterium]|nr:glycoside hydrolase family 2 TIM barrel-domain containing protein [Ktedonobacteraceae bacterium]
MSLRSRLFAHSSLMTLIAILIAVASCFWFVSDGNIHRTNVRQTIIAENPTPSINTLHVPKISYPTPTPTPTPTAEPTAATGTTQNTFVTRSGSSLLLNGQPFRFSGADIYWLGLTDHPTTANPISVMSGPSRSSQTPNSVDYPTQFQIKDALQTAQTMGATVIRSFAVESVGCSLCIEPNLGTFNNNAFNTIDYAIQQARTYGIKLILPLVDNWWYYTGGKHTFTAWENDSNENDFYTNVTVIAQFEAYVSHILNHVNTYTGIAYKNDPTIMAWETGNELSAPSSWVQSITTYIKGIDQNHLVMDGNYEQADELANFLPDLNIKTVDIYTGHYYPPTISALQTEVNQVTNAQKVFIVGEYDWNTTQGDSLSNFLSSISQSSVAGDMYWSLFPHDNNHGFVANTEHFTLHYPGDTSDMQSRVSLLRTHAYRMQGLSVPTATLPGIPYITEINGNAVSWRGAFGADTYTVERSTQGVNGPWTVICNRCATDLSTPWSDTTQPSGAVAYRVRAYSVSGIQGPYSNIYAH